MTMRVNGEYVVLELELELHIEMYSFWCYFRVSIQHWNDAKWCEVAGGLLISLRLRPTARIQGMLLD